MQIVTSGRLHGYNLQVSKMVVKLVNWCGAIIKVQTTEWNKLAKI